MTAVLRQSPLSLVASAVRAVDRAVARTYLSMFAERGSLSTFLFHGLFRDEAEIERDEVDPQQRTTVADFRAFLEYFLAAGYRFVSVADVLAGLRPGGRYAMVTFDDGYYNNVRALPLLREYRIPAAFFISTDHVRQTKCFWWDVLYRQRRRDGASPAEIARQTAAMKAWRTERAEAELTRCYGAAAFRPVSDVDRPFTPSELRDFAADPLVTVGNHTANHAILTRYTPAQARRQLTAAQNALHEMTGNTPEAIAYPNGDYSAPVLRACRELGFRLGIGVDPRKNRLPLRPGASGDGWLRLGRFTPRGGPDLQAQCAAFRSDFRLYDTARALAR